MANSKNTLWMVSCVQWTMTPKGESDINYCDSRGYRSENYARARYKAVLNYYKEAGYSIHEIATNEDDVYEGIRARRSKVVNGTRRVSHAVLYIDRNPVWDPR